MVLVDTWLEQTSNVSIGSPSGGVVSCVLVDLLLFRIFFMCTFTLGMDGGRCFIRPTVSLGYTEKWPFLMDRRRFLWTGLKSVEWYHCARSGLVIYARALSASDCDWLSGWYGLL